MTDITKLMVGTDEAESISPDLPKGIAEVRSRVEWLRQSHFITESLAGDVSPDGSTLLLISQGDGLGPANTLWSLTAAASLAPALANARRCSIVSRRGEDRLLHDRRRNLRIGSDGTEAHRIASPGGYVKSPACHQTGVQFGFPKEGLPVGDVIEWIQSSPASAGMGSSVLAVERTNGLRMGDSTSWPMANLGSRWAFRIR